MNKLVRLELIPYEICEEVCKQMDILDHQPSPYKSSKWTHRGFAGFMDDYGTFRYQV